MVFVVDAHKQALMPCTEKRARLLLDRHRAVIHKMFPFTIRLKDRTLAASILQPLWLKLDPGSRTTGVALVLEGAHGARAIFLAEIVHKTHIARRLQARRALRRGRRFRHTRYRPARFQNRRRAAGWLPPSLTARVDQTRHVVTRLMRLAPVTAVAVEHVAFDTQKLQHPEITGVEYQHGTLLGYEVREYLLAKWHHCCAYCDATDVPLEVEHITPLSRGGSHRVSNLALACHACNVAKGAQPLAVFLTHDRDRRRRAARNAHPRHADPRQTRAEWDAARLGRIAAQRQAPLRDAAMLNATRWRLYAELKAMGLPVEGGSGGRTKMQRLQHGLPKEHYYDALCVGVSTPAAFTGFPAYVAVWTATGRGTRKMCGTDTHGFPIRHRTRHKQHFGFQTGDLVVATVPQGKYAGVWRGRVSVRATGRFDISADGQRIAAGVSHKYCRVLQREDGWQYAHKHRAV